MKKVTQLTLAHYKTNGALDFQNYWKATGRKVHGGAHATGKRKTKRPFDSKKPIHIVMRSESARGLLRLNHRRNKDTVENLVTKWAKKLDVRIYNFANAGNHLHLLARAKNRPALQRFLRVITGLISRAITGSRKGDAKGKFWSGLTFTRIADWGKQFRTVDQYVVQNILEAAGVIPYRARSTTGPPF